MPLDSTAVGSNCPTSKSIVVRLVPEQGRERVSEGSGAPIGSDRGHKSTVEPEHLS